MDDLTSAILAVIILAAIVGWVVINEILWLLSFINIELV